MSSAKDANRPDVTNCSGQLATPVLFLVFNRSDTTAKVFDAIRQVQPERLYVAADGPRADRKGEAAKCKEVRRIATNVDWPCEVKTLFRDENLGCRRAVSGAIDWFFEHEEQGVILEDDCLPGQSFFEYATELLERYKDDMRIMCISAQHFHGNEHQPEHSYFFSRYNHCWGWATWKRAWQHYDHDMSQWPTLRDGDWLLGIGNGSRVFRDYWTRIFDSAYAGELDSWAYRWTFSCWAQNALAILPAKNLVTNIGFGQNATHTSESVGGASALPLEELSFPLAHPEIVVRDVEADAWSDKHHFGISSLNALKRKIRRLPGGGVFLAIYRGLKRSLGAAG